MLRTSFFGHFIISKFVPKKTDALTSFVFNHNHGKIFILANRILENEVKICSTNFYLQNKRRQNHANFSLDRIFKYLSIKMDFNKAKLYGLDEPKIVCLGKAASVERLF